MSSARKARFPSAKASTQRTQSRRQERNRSLTAPTAKLLSQQLQLHHLRQHRIIAVPLHEIGTTHESSMLGSAAVVVPQIEIKEVGAVGKGGALEQAIGAQPVEDGLGIGYALVGDIHYLLRLLVHAVDERLGVALLADLLHI